MNAISARGVIEEIIVPSPHRRSAPCRHFGICGGCQLQHLDYAAQCQSKADIIRESLRRIGGIVWEQDIEVLAADEFGYRSRAELKRTPDGRLGYFQANSHDLCEVTECPILLPTAQDKLQTLRTQNIPKSATRVYLTAGDTEVLATPATGENARTAEVDARGTVEQTILGFNYRFGVRTFFQANRLLVEQLVCEATDEAKGRIAFDLYAGAGLFSLPLARHFDQVYAVEGSRLSVRHGLANAERNKVQNIRYEAVSVETWLKQPKLPRPDFVLLDPPRAGAGEPVIRRLLQHKPTVIRYVSCDPTTLARDLKILTQGGYRLTTITALDMFPQTYHIETVIKLSAN
ncbi:MAG: class I SAM-dependent RNA methyltransferase [Blastocatellia bacterium]